MHRRPEGPGRHFPARLGSKRGVLMIKEVYRAVRKRQSALMLLGLVLCLCGGCFLTRQAEAAADVTASVPVFMEADGITEVFEVVLHPQKEGDGEQKLYLTHGKHKSFVLTFQAADVGEHYYTLSQTKGTDKTITYDESVYQLYVKVTDEGGTLKAVTALWKDGTDAKLEKVTFINQKTQGTGGTGGDHTGDDGSNGGTGDGNDDGNGPGNGEDINGGNGADDGTGDSSGNGTGTGNGGTDGTGSGSGSFWGNGGFWGSSSSGSSASGFWGSALVRTGDRALTAVWAGLLLAALLLAAGMLLYKKQKDDETNRKDREDG